MLPRASTSPSIPLTCKVCHGALALPDLALSGAQKQLMKHEKPGTYSNFGVQVLLRHGRASARSPPRAKPAYPASACARSASPPKGGRERISLKGRHMTPNGEPSERMQTREQSASGCVAGWSREPSRPAPAWQTGRQARGLDSRWGCPQSAQASLVQTCDGYIVSWQPRNFGPSPHAC